MSYLISVNHSRYTFIHLPVVSISTVMNLMELLTFGKTDILDEEERKRPDLKPVIESGQCHQDLR